MAWARDMIAEGVQTRCEVVPLGPSLGQCCGGSVTLEFSVASAVPAQAAPLWIWGAGHVGRAIAQVCAGLPGRDVTLIDTHTDRMPGAMRGVTPVVAVDMPRLVPHAPAAADHLIVTYSHEIDLALCHALLGHPFASVGLIGSATKWARFRGRLLSLGHAPDQIARIACPIGDPSLGKHPQAIAVGVAAALLRPPRSMRGDKTG